MDFSLVVQEKAVPLHSQTRKYKFRLQNIGIWCNGNTTDSGPVIPGSNPGIPTRRQVLTSLAFFLCTYSFRPYSLYTPPIRIHAGSPFSLSIEPIYLGSLHYLREIILPLIYSCIISLTDHTDSLDNRCALMIPLQGVDRLG